jgi:hypothetical protein
LLVSAKTARRAKLDSSLVEVRVLVNQVVRGQSVAAGQDETQVITSVETDL